MRPVKFIAVTALFAFLMTSLSACNTVRGAGEDLQRGGQAIENAADRAAK